MAHKIRVAVASPSFNKSRDLMDELTATGVEVICNAQLIRFDEPTLISFLKESCPEVAIVGLEPITSFVLDECPSLRMISKYGVGTDNLDLEALKARNIDFGWTSGVNKRSVCELVLSFSLGHFRNVFSSISKMANGIWEKNGGCQLSNLTFGIVGLGHIGADLARLLKAFGCNVLFNDILDKAETSKELGIKAVGFNELLKLCDVISFHVPSTPSTQRMFSRKEIYQTKKSALIINTSRGNILDFDEVVQAVRANHLGGFASDVFDYEPFNAEIYAGISNLYFTPHIGGNSREAVMAMGRSSIDHVRKYVAHKFHHMASHV